MLVLSRRTGESIVINDNVTVTIVDVRGDKVRIGIDAPREVSIHRQEVFELIRQEQEQRATQQPDAASQTGTAGES